MIQHMVHKYGGCQTWNTNIQSCVYCVDYFTIVIQCLCPHNCTLLMMLPQVVFPCIPKFKLHLKPTLKVQLPN